MKLEYNFLKKKYLKYFDNDENYCDFFLSDAIFGFSEIFDFLKNNNISSVLEVGSGPGILINEFKTFFPKISFEGIDPNINGFHKLKRVSEKLKKDYNIKILDSNVEKYRENKKFDLIFSVNVFEHVSDQSLYLSNTQEALKKNGFNIILCPNYDFPYEPHFVIPIVINKKITKFIFKSRIRKVETLIEDPNLWDGLQFKGKRWIKKFLKKAKCNYFFDEDIKSRMLNRLDYDKEFKRRQGITTTTIAIMCKFLKIDKLIFDFLKIPFPYMKLIIKK